MSRPYRRKKPIPGERLPALLLLLLLGSLTVSAAAQPNRADTLDAAIHFNKGQSFREAARYDSSNHYFNSAIADFKKHRIWDRAMDGLINVAGNFIETGDFVRASDTIGEVDRIMDNHTPGRPLYRARIYRLKGRLDNARAQYAGALAWSEKALQALQHVEAEVESADHAKIRAAIISDIGNTYDSQGNFDKALEHFFNALEIYIRNIESPDRSLIGQLYNNIGVAYRNKGDNRKALQYYRKALDIDRNIWKTDHPAIAQDLNNIAIVYYYQGDYRQALDYLKKATKTLSGYFGEQHPQVAAGYNNIGIVYSEMNRFEAAIDYLQKSLEIKRNIFGDVHTDVAIGYQNLGALYFDLGANDSAIKYYQKALDLHLQIFDGPHPEIATVYANLGEVYSRKKHFRKAREYFRKDLKININLLGERHPFIGDTYNKIGQTYASRENYSSAITYYNRAATVLAGEYGDRISINDLELERVSHPVFMLETLENKGLAHRSLYDQSGRPEQLKRALDTFLKTAVFVEQLQFEYRSEESKMLLGQKAFEIFEYGLKTAYMLHKNTGEARYSRYALHLAERSKARVLLEQLMEMNAKEFAEIPDSLLEYEDGLRRKLTRLNESIREQATQSTHFDSLGISVHQDSIFSLKQKLKSHVRYLEKNYRRYYELKYEQVTVDPAFIQNELLDAGQTLVEYFYGDESLFAFTITPQRMKIHKIEADTSLASRLRAFRRAIIGNDMAEYAVLGSSLYAQIFKPLESSIEGDRLLIIPDGPLNHLPFEALLTQSGAQTGLTDYRDATFLARQYEISYAPSASYLLYRQRHFRQSNRKRIRFLGLAPGFSTMELPGENRNILAADDYLPSLPLSGHEVEQIASLIESPPNLIDRILRTNRSTVFVRSEATETVFKKQPLERYDIIHLATHAFWGAEDMEHSGIAFSSQANPSDDGILHLDEIYNLYLKADLVVLSACDTGIGTVVRGEGMLSLARAFQYAGSKNLLVSLWQVYDRSAVELILRFYEELLSGASMPASLRKAKLELMDHPVYAAPLYWAPFILLGK